jgi:hypothetical protein
LGEFSLGCAAVTFSGDWFGSRRFGVIAFRGGAGGGVERGGLLCERVCGRRVLLWPFAAVGAGPAICFTDFSYAFMKLIL